MAEYKPMKIFGFLTEVDVSATRAWYAQAENWDCSCAHCRNFLALAAGRRLPGYVLQFLDRFGIPPQKATYVCQLYREDPKGNCYQFSYRLSGNILSGTSTQGPGYTGQCLHETYPFGAPGFPEPHFDVEFCEFLPWALPEPDGASEK